MFALIIIRQTDVPILNESACEKSFADIDSKTQVCAGYKGLEKDTCEVKFID